MRRAPVAVAALGAALVLALTLFPFDFRTGRPGVFDWNLRSPRPVADAPVNIVLFLPLGFGLGAMLAGVKCWLAVLLATLSAGALSLSVETLQIMLDRHPDVSDLLTNALGGGAGAWLAHRHGLAIEGWVAGRSATLRRRATPGVLVVASTVWVAAWAAAGIALRGPVTLASWDTEYPLLVGNEKTGERPWLGEVRSVWLGPEEPATTPAAEHHYRAATGWRAEAGKFPDLVWRGREATEETSQLEVGPSRWLESAAPLRGWLAAARAASRFRIGTELRTLDSDQSGPARIVSLSESIWRRNLTIGQQGTDLVIRLRCEITSLNAHEPPFVVRGVLGDDRWHRVEVGFADSRLRVTVDGDEHVFELDRWLTAIGDAFGIDAWDSMAIHWLYYALLAGPAAVLLGLAWRGRRLHHA